MANTLTGRIIAIRPTASIPTKSGNTFQKREIIIDCTRVDEFGQHSQFENTPCITFTQERCALLDAFAPGQVVTISFDVEGRYYQPKDSYFNDVRGYKIEAVQPAAPAPAPAPQYAPQPAPSPAQTAFEGYGYPQQVQYQGYQQR